jgi:hypothetical protein
MQHSVQVRRLAELYHQTNIKDNETSIIVCYMECGWEYSIHIFSITLIFFIYFSFEKRKESFLIEKLLRGFRGVSVKSRFSSNKQVMNYV